MSRIVNQKTTKTKTVIKLTVFLNVFTLKPSEAKAEVMKKLIQRLQKKRPNREFLQRSRIFKLRKQPKQRQSQTWLSFILSSQRMRAIATENLMKNLIHKNLIKILCQQQLKKVVLKAQDYFLYLSYKF